MKKTLMALSVAVAALSAQGLEAKTLKWAFQGDAQSLDPQSLNETFTLGLLGNIYEGLVRRGPTLALSRPGDQLENRRTETLALHPAQGRDLP